MQTHHHTWSELARRMLRFATATHAVPAGYLSDHWIGFSGVPDPEHYREPVPQPPIAHASTGA